MKTAGLGLLCILAMGSHASQQREVFSSRTEAVRVDVLVSRNGRPVRGLDATAFEVDDDGVRQRVSIVDVDEAPVHVVLVLDTSASLAGKGVAFVRGAVRLLLPRLSPRDRVSLVTFGEAVRIHSVQSSGHSELIQALDSVVATGPTDLNDAIAAGLILSAAGPVRSVGLVFTDGVDTASRTSAKTLLDAARRSNMVLYGVSTTRGEDAAHLRTLSEATGGRVFEIPALDQLQEAFQNILEEFRSRYTLMFTPECRKRAGWHALEVNVKGNASVNARRGYYVPK